ncbi:MAG: C39 family peptidase [Clostridia bacterium]|nr:C39 family peptidase [Clostridia bacterium]
MSFFKKHKIITYTICAILAVAVAISAVVLVITILNNPKNSDISINSALSSENDQYFDTIIIEKTTIEETIKQTATVKPNQKNIIKVQAEPIDASALSKQSVKIPVKYVPQNPELPTGCEITALTTVLNYYDYKVSKTTMSDNYLEKTMDKMGNFWDVFVGDPRGKGFGCYASPIVNAANKYIASHGNRHKAVDYSGAKFENLLKLVEQGRPVIIWGTVYSENEKNLREPYISAKWNINGKKIDLIVPEHCMVLIGYDLDRGVAIMSDPLRGIAEYDLLTVKSRYMALHSQCVVLEELPIITGVKDGETYYTTQSVNISNSNIKSVTLNGKKQETAFLIKGNIEKTYTIVVTDINNNKITITVYTKPISALLEPLDDLKISTVTENDKQLISEIKAAVLELDTSYISPEERTAIDKTAEFCDLFLERIEDVKNELTQITKDLNKLAKDGIDFKDSDQLSDISIRLDALIYGQNLTETQQINAKELKTKCQNYINSIAPAEDF